MSEQRKAILESLAAGEIDAQEAAMQLGALRTVRQQDSAESPSPKATAPPKLRIKATRANAIVLNVELPLKLMEFGQQMGGRFMPQFVGPDWNELDMTFGDDKENIRIYVA